MNKKATIILAACLVSFVDGQVVDSAYAEGSSPFNMMNPSRWFGGKSREHDGYYDHRYSPYDGYGPYSGPPYSGPGYSMPYGPPGAPGHGAPYDFPPRYGYGTPPAPQGYAPTRIPAPVAPQQTDDASASRIRELEERIRQLEASRQMPPQTATPSWQGTDNAAVPQTPSEPQTWQGGTNMPAPPSPPSWQGSESYSQPTHQAPMPPPWQRSAGGNPQSVIEPSAAPSWQGAGATPRKPTPPAPELQGEASEQRHRFRPY